MHIVQLSPEDLAALYAVLPAVFTREEFDVVLIKYCGSDNRLDRLTGNAGLETQVVDVVTRATKGGWLAKLVLGSSKERGNSAELQRLALVVNAQIAAIERARLSDPYEVIWLSRSRPMINRKDLRTRARDMFIEDLAKVMIVRGKSKTGRSHSMLYFQHLAADQGFDVIDLNLVQLVKLKTRLNAYQFATILNESFGVEFGFSPNEEDRQDAFKVEPFVQALIRALKKRPERSVLIVDGFDHVEPEDSGLSLLHRLADAAEVSLTNLRVVLLGHEADLVLELGAPPLHDETLEFTDEEVGGFFERFYREVLQQSSPKDEDILRDSAAAMRAALPGQPNVSAVSAKITEVCRDLIAKQKSAQPALPGGN
jgi:hypothetical protein